MVRLMAVHVLIKAVRWLARRRDHVARDAEFSEQGEPKRIFVVQGLSEPHGNPRLFSVKVDFA
jgi:hypothetical protein